MDTINLDNKFSLITFAEKTNLQTIEVPFTISDKENIDECLRVIKNLSESVNLLQHDLSDVIYSNRQLNIKVESLEVENQSIKS